MDIGVGDAVAACDDIESQAMDIFEAGHKIGLIREAIENATRSPDKAFQYLHKLRENVPMVPINSKVKLNFISEILPTDDFDQLPITDITDPKTTPQEVMSATDNTGGAAGGATGGAAGGGNGENTGGGKNSNGAKINSRGDARKNAQNFAQLSKQDISEGEQRNRESLIEQWRTKQKVVNKRIPYY